MEEEEDKEDIEEANIDINVVRPSAHIARHFFTIHEKDEAEPFKEAENIAKPVEKIRTTIYGKASDNKNIFG